jgi:hypothetical protein
MYNWSTDLKKLQKYPEKFKIWKLEQLINFGLGDEKIDEKELKKYFSKLRIDPLKRRFLKTLIS